MQWYTLKNSKRSINTGGGGKSASEIEFLNWKVSEWSNVCNADCTESDTKQMPSFSSAVVWFVGKN